MSLALENIRTVDTGCLSLNQDFLGTGAGYRHFFNRQDLRAARLLDRNDTHEFRILENGLGVGRGLFALLYLVFPANSVFLKRIEVSRF